MSKVLRVGREPEADDRRTAEVVELPAVVASGRPKTGSSLMYV